MLSITVTPEAKKRNKFVHSKCFKMGKHETCVYIGGAGQVIAHTSGSSCVHKSFPQSGKQTKGNYAT